MIKTKKKKESRPAATKVSNAIQQHEAAPVDTGIGHENRYAVTEILSVFLADEFILHAKTLFAHWNVSGPDFHEKHLFFGGQYELLNEMMDEVAERIRMLGYFAPATIYTMLQATHLPEFSGNSSAGIDLVKELLADQEHIIRRLREQIDPVNSKFKDAGTSDFLTGLMEKHEKMAWMLRVQLTG